MPGATRLCLLFSCAALSSATLACGGAPARSTVAAESGALPSTDRDPLPFTPAPGGPAASGETVALSASGGEDQARRMLPALLEALRDGDEARLEQTFAEEVFAASGPRAQSAGQPRVALVQRVLAYARRGIIAAETPIEDLIELEAIEVTRAAVTYRNRDMPEALRPTDLVVEAPITEGGRGPLRTLLNWHARAQLVVRPGRDPRIVAF